MSKITLKEVKKADYIGLPGEKGMYSRLTIPDGWLEVAYEVWEGSHSYLRYRLAPATKRVRREAFRRVFYQQLLSVLGRLSDDGGYLKVFHPGGEYIYRCKGWGKWEVMYHTYCPGCGIHESREVTEADVFESIKFENLPPSAQQGNWWRMKWKGDKLVMVEIDQTGHD